MSDREIVAEALVEQSRLQQFVDVMTPLVDECKLRFTDEGIRARVVDPANVASIIPVQLNDHGCESLDIPGDAVVGANVGRIDEYINAANAGDLIRLRLDMETRKLLIDYREIHHEMALIDANAVRKEPDLPDLDLPNTIVIEGGTLDEAREVTDLVSDHIEIDTAEDKESVVLIGAGDVDESTYTLDADTLIMNGIREQTSTLLSLDYVEELVKPIPSDAEVTLSYGEDFPVTFEWSAKEGSIEVKQLLAPRIQAN